MTGIDDNYIVLQYRGSQLLPGIITLEQARQEGLNVDLERMVWGVEGKEPRSIYRIDGPDVDDHKGFMGVYDRTSMEHLNRLVLDTTHIAKKHLKF